MNRSCARMLSYCCVVVCGLAVDVVLAAPPRVTKAGESTVDARGMTLREGAPYGRAANGQSFQTESITSFKGWQYAVYWVRQQPPVGGRPADKPLFHLAVSRRQGTDAAWQVLDLPESKFRNGYDKSGKPSNAHNTASIAICEGDGTLHLAYDHHGNNLRYRATAPGVATDPAVHQWDASTFKPETSELIPGAKVTTVTYPSFIRKPDGGLNLVFRRGGSGVGSWWIYDYSAKSHAWSDGRQYDEGLIDAYTVVAPPSPTRCAYPNGWTYGPDGKLHSTFVYRETAANGSGGNGSNHDVHYVWSDDGGFRWRNNAGAIISDTRSGQPKPAFTLTSPGLVVRPLPQTSSLMNTQGQAVDHAGRIHCLMWHKDPSKPTSSGDPVWDTVASSYFHHWRDDTGAWHRVALPSKPGDPIGSRPKLLFDKSDNAYAVYTLRSGADKDTKGIYFNEADLVIATASADSRWADWTVVHTEAGPFGNEVMVDPQLFESAGVLSVMMQTSPTADLQATPIRVFNFTPTPQL